MKKGFLMMIVLILAAMLGGCAGEGLPSTSQTPAPVPEVAPSVEEPSYDTLLIKGHSYTLGDTFSSEELFSGGERITEDHWCSYETQGYFAQTFLQEDGKEWLAVLIAWDEGETPEGIRIGSSLEELKATYPSGLYLLEGMTDDGAGNEPAYTHAYAAGVKDPANGVYTSEIFFLYEGTVVKICIADGMDLSGPPTSDSDMQADVIALDSLAEVGKSYEELCSSYPDAAPRTVGIPDAAGLCLGRDRDPFLYFFLGTQAGPSLQELDEANGHELKCAGIVSTVAEVFPRAVEGQPLGAFFADHAVSDYTYELEEGPGQGWIEFIYDGYLVWIDTNDDSSAPGGYEAAETMSGDFTVFIIDMELFEENNAIQDRYWEELFSKQEQAYTT